uniref:hypothetical protein n=1 Tax=Ornithobacterium rhinotracheale TaxID=28251 RepID=UPI00129C2845|nr:hypothetical protein [Ornithobacterium rhinotracheale]
MKTFKVFSLCLLGVLLLASCGGNSDCVKRAMEDGYSREDAEEFCNEAQLDGQLRGGGY